MFEYLVWDDEDKYNLPVVIIAESKEAAQEHYIEQCEQANIVPGNLKIEKRI